MDRLQRQADIARAQQIASTSGAISALGAGLGALGGGILPPEISLETQNDINVFEDAGVNINDIFGAEAQNKANQQQIAQNIGLNLAGIAAGSGGLNAGANVLPNQSNIPASKPVTLTQISNALMNM